MHNNQFSDLVNRGETSILKTYKRFPVSFNRGKGSYLYDENENEYLDFASGIAVTCLGHAHPEIADTIYTQANSLTHVSNLYYSSPQIELAEVLNLKIGSGRIFYANSGAEANECLYKFARLFGKSRNRYEIICMQGSFHGRTMAGISATGQEKVKNGFAPLLDGFTHVPFNSIDAVKDAYNEKTAAVLIEGIQGEGGIIPADPDYLISLREFCTQKNILLLIDAVQCGFYRTGSFQSYQEILKDDTQDFLPDAISMAKSLGGGFPIGAAWIASKYADVLGPGTHGSTFGGNPLACKVSLKIIEIIERDKLTDNIKPMGELIKTSLNELKNTFPQLIKSTRGLGLLQAFELHSITPPKEYEALPASSYFCLLALKNGLLLVPAGNNVVRLMPQYRVSKSEVEEAIRSLKSCLELLVNS